MEENKSNIKIAILLSGMLRHWDITSTMFYYLQDLYKKQNVEIDFYLSTWKDYENFYTYEHKGHHQPYENKNPNLKIKKVTFSDPDNLPVHKNDTPSFFHSYVKSKLAFLFKDDFNDYDCAIITRSDSFIYKELIDSIVNDVKERNITGYNLNNKKIIYSDTGSRAKSDDELFCDKDTLFFGNPRIVLNYVNFHSYALKHKFPGIHNLEADFLNDNGIYNRKHLLGTTHELVRHNINENKKFVPHLNSLKIMDKKWGKDIYKFTKEELRNLFEKYR